MITTIPAGKKSVPIYDGSASCEAYGVILQSLDSNGQIYVSGNQNGLDGTVDANGNPGAGFLIGKSTVITNVPSTVIIAPCSQALYARNTGANDSLLSVEVFKL